jgi:hypothetical protein
MWMYLSLIKFYLGNLCAPGKQKNSFKVEFGCQGRNETVQKKGRSSGGDVTSRV